MPEFVSVIEMKRCASTVWVRLDFKAQNAVAVILRYAVHNTKISSLEREV